VSLKRYKQIRHSFTEFFVMERQTLKNFSYLFLGAMAP